MIKIGEAFKKARRGTGRSQEDVARLAGVSKRALANLELGKGSFAVLQRAAPIIEFRLAGVAHGGSLAVQLYAARKKKRLSQEALARRAGVALSTVQNLERGVGHISSLEAVLSVLASNARVRRAETAHWDKGKRDDRLTPSWLLTAIAEVFGHISLDPCASRSRLIPADRHFFKEDDGLAQRWDAELVYVNCPFSRASEWIRRARQAWYQCEAKTVIGLFPARLNTNAFHEHIAGRADILLLHGKPSFHAPDKGGELGGVAFGIMLAIWGGDPEKVLRFARGLRCAFIPAHSVEVCSGTTPPIAVKWTESCEAGFVSNAA